MAQTTLTQPMTSASYNADNQLTQWGGTAMSYDLNGNLTSDGVHAYTWSPRNLLSAVDSDSTAEILGPDVRGGWNFNPFTSPRTFGPRAMQEYSRDGISGAMGTGASMGSSFAGRKDNGC